MRNSGGQAGRQAGRVLGPGRRRRGASTRAGRRAGGRAGGPGAGASGASTKCVNSGRRAGGRGPCCLPCRICLTRDQKIMESFLVGARKRSTIMALGPIYGDFAWNFVGLWSLYRVIARSTLHHPETLHDPPAPWSFRLVRAQHRRKEVAADPGRLEAAGALRPVAVRRRLFRDHGDLAGSVFRDHGDLAVSVSKIRRDQGNWEFMSDF